MSSIAKFSYLHPIPIISDPDPVSPVMGCTESHIEALTRGKNTGDRAFAIFEDDARFVTNNLRNYIKYIPRDWDIIVLGVNSTKSPEKINEYCSRIKFLCGSHAMIFRNIPRVIDPILQTLLFYDSFVDYGYSDVITANNLNCYLVHPFIAKSVPTGQSNIRGGSIDDSETQNICESALLA